jgi:ATPase subunit of ABC transporter with duplicated ATPase domains
VENEIANESESEPESGSDSSIDVSRLKKKKEQRKQDKNKKEQRKESESNIDYDLNNQQLTTLINEKIQQAQSSAVKKEDSKHEKEEGEMLRTSSFISRGSIHSARMKDTTLDHPKVLSNSKHPIVRICLTGGPCAGKTTAMATLTTVLA